MAALDPSKRTSAAAWCGTIPNQQNTSRMTAWGAGVSDDVGPMIAALLSDENRWVNGQRIEVSGGISF